MISVSSAIQDILEADARDIDMRILKASDSSEVDCSIKSINVYKGACGEFGVGTIYVPYAEIECDFNPTMPDEIIIQFGVNVSGTRTYTSMGKFVITSNEKSVYTTKYIAQGMLSKTVNDVLFSTEPVTKTLASIMSAITTKGYSVTYKNGLTIPAYEITQLISGISVRDALQIVATCVGGFVTEDNNGGFVMSKYNPCTTSNLDLSGARSSSIPQFKGVYEVLGCKVVVDDETTFEETDYNLEVENPYFTSAMWNDYKANLTGLEFSAGEFEVSLGDPRLEAWDCVKITDDDSVDHYMPCLTLSFAYTGGLSMSIVADATLDDEAEASIGGVITTKLSEVKAQSDENRANLLTETARAIAAEIDAAETATSYITSISNQGVQIKSSTEANNNVEIDSNGMRINQDIDGTETEVASFGANTIELGKNSVSSTIELCGGEGKITYDNTDDHLEIKCDGMSGGTGILIFSDGSTKIASDVDGYAELSIADGQIYALCGGISINNRNSVPQVDFNETYYANIVASDEITFDGTTSYCGAGFLSTSKTRIGITIPLNRLITAQNVTITNLQAITRQGGNYTHGSSAGGYVDWTVASAIITPAGIRLFMSRSTTTNAINNDVIAVDLTCTMTFS